jgi:aminoglycoside 6'-N-acetyltransferase I
MGNAEISKFEIIELTSETVGWLAKLFTTMWPETKLKEELEDCERICKSNKETAYLVRDQEIFIAFIYLATRSDYVSGANTSPVAYIEGIYVAPEYRNSQIGRLLVQKGEEWAKKTGSKQLASDTEIQNKISIGFHTQLGFKEANRVVCFIKDIR